MIIDQNSGQDLPLQSRKGGWVDEVAHETIICFIGYYLFG